MRKFRSAALLLAAALCLLAQSPDPWTKSDLMPPADLAAQMTKGKAPVVFYVGFPVMYRNTRIRGAVLAGPASKAEGLDTLRQELQKLPKDANVVLYCGCCPWVQCPNVRPAFQLVKQLGMTRVRILELETNLSKDWVQKGYPTEKPGAPAAD